MNKIIKLFLTIFVTTIIFVLASCSKSNGGFVGKLSATSKRTEINVSVEFDKNQHLEDGTAKVIVRLYEDNESKAYKTEKSVKLTNGISGTCDFTSLNDNTSYILKLYVTYDGKEYEIDTMKKSTRETGNDLDTAIEITTKEEFLAMADAPDAYYILKNDLDLNGKELELFNSSDTAFTGTFDGGNHKISGFTFETNTYSGLFGYVSKATIKNFTLDCDQAPKADGTPNSVFTLTTTPKYFGAVCGYVESSTLENITVVNPYVTNTNYSSSDTNFGLFAGYIKHTNITNCKLEKGTLTFTSINTSSSYTASVGGFIGTIVGTCAVANCSVEATITLGVNGTGQISIGGFAGTNDSSKTIEESYFKGKLKVTKGSSTSKDLSVGGFVGQSVSGPCNLLNCVAKADLEVTASADTTIMATVLNFGGIVGDLASTTFGVKNCVYSPLTEQTTGDDGKVTGGMIFCGKVEDPTGDDKVYNTKISLTIGKVGDGLNTKVIDVVAYENCLSYKGIAGEAVANTIIIPTISKNISFLSDGLQDIVR